MNIISFLGTNKLIYLLLGVVVFIVFITVLIIIGRIGGGTFTAADLEFWGVFDTRQDFNNVIRTFQQANPGFKVNYRQFSYEDYEKSLIDALASGTGPDIIMMHHTWLAKHRDKFAPIPTSSNFENFKFMTSVDFKNQFVDVAYDDLVYQDKIYAMPLYVDSLALYYNKDMFNSVGIVRPPETWEEFNKDAELLTKFDSQGNIIQAGAAMGTSRNINRSTDILAALMIQNGTRMTDPSNTTATFTRAVDGIRVGENALEYYTDFSNPEKVVYSWNGDQHYSIDQFVEGRVAMMFNYSHQIPVVTGRFERLNFGIAPMPQFDRLNSKTYANYWAAAVSNSSPNKEAAWFFLGYLASTEGTRQYLADTSRPSARRDIINIQRDDSKIGIFAVQALSAKSWFQVDNVAFDQIFADMIDGVNIRKEKVRDALRSAEAKISVLMSK